MHSKNTRSKPCAPWGKQFKNIKREHSIAAPSRALNIRATSSRGEYPESAYLHLRIPLEYARNANVSALRLPDAIGIFIKNSQKDKEARAREEIYARALLGIDEPSPTSSLDRWNRVREARDARVWDIPNNSEIQQRASASREMGNILAGPRNDVFEMYSWEDGMCVYVYTSCWHTLWARRSLLFVRRWRGPITAPTSFVFSPSDATPTASMSGSAFTLGE